MVIHPVGLRLLVSLLCWRTDELPSMARDSERSSASWARHTRESHRRQHFSSSLWIGFVNIRCMSSLACQIRNDLRLENQGRFSICSHSLHARLWYRGAHKRDLSHNHDHWACITCYGGFDSHYQLTTSRASADCVGGRRILGEWLLVWIQAWILIQTRFLFIHPSDLALLSPLWWNCLDKAYYPVRLSWLSCSHETRRVIFDPVKNIHQPP